MELAALRDYVLYDVINKDFVGSWGVIEPSPAKFRDAGPELVKVGSSSTHKQIFKLELGSAQGSREEQVQSGEGVGCPTPLPPSPGA